METLLNKIKGQSILVIGDVMLDHYIWGDTQRISPEAPVPVVDIKEDTFRAGGAANVTHNLEVLGAETALCGWIGDDEGGRRLQQLFQEEGVVFDPFFIHKTAPTILKKRVMVRNQQLCRLDREGIPAVYHMEDPIVFHKLVEKINTVQGIILSDYAKGVLTQPMADQLIRIAHENNIFIAYDPKPRRTFYLKDADLLTPNRQESLQLAGINLHPGESYPAELVCQKIYELYTPKYLVITLGADGMFLCESGKIQKQLPTYAREVYDVSGAGDTVVASLTAALVAGASLEEAAHLANTAAGVVVSKVGTATASPIEILNYHP